MKNRIFALASAFSFVVTAAVAVLTGNDWHWLLYFWGILAGVFLLVGDRVLLECVQRPEKVFLLLALPTALAIRFVVRPVSVMDAHNHLTRAYQVSQGWFRCHQGVEQSPEASRWYAAVLAQHANRDRRPFSKRTAYLEGLRFECGIQTQRHSIDNYTPLAYACSGLCALIARKADLDLADGVYLISLACLFLYVFVAYKLLELLPRYKWQFCQLLLFPQVLWLGISYSADAFCILSSFALVAFVVFLRERDKGYSVRDLTLLALLAILSCQCKYVYFPLLAVLFLLPSERFPSKRFRWQYIGGVIVLALGLAFLWNCCSPIPDSSIDGRTFAEKLQFVLHHPLEYAGIWCDLFWRRSVLESVGMWLSYNRFILADYHVYFLCAFVSSCLLLKEHHWSLLQRALAALAWICCVGVVDTAQYVSYASDFSGVQGRYFAPLLPLGCIVLGQGKFGLPERYAAYYKGFLVMFLTLTQVAVIETARRGWWL